MTDKHASIIQLKDFACATRLTACCVHQGARHPYSIPRGLLSDATKQRIRTMAEERLPPPMRSLVLATSEPFLQVVTDGEAIPFLFFFLYRPSDLSLDVVFCPTATFDQGHTILVGDALCGPRPHTAASTNQAAFHALSLHSMLEGSDGQSPLGLAKLRGDWEPFVLRYARELYKSGQSMGNLSQFGDHPMSVDNVSGSRKETERAGEPIGSAQRRP
jgi:hypothetical protein